MPPAGLDNSDAARCARDAILTNGGNMNTNVKRRTLLAAGASALALGALPAAQAQAKTKLRFSSAFTDQDLRAEAYRNFAASIKDSFDFEPYFGNTLFKQGAELVAMQRGNLEMVNLAPADISKQVPAWSLMTSAYLFRDADHLKKTFKSDVGREFIKIARDQLGIQVITPVYFGARHVNLKPDRVIKTPADMAGIKLRMPPGEFWQFLGESIGANPTPVAYAEVYTALQTGAIDGQDNPLVASRLMKFYEVTTQFVLTSHVIGYDVMAVTTKVWDAMTPAQQAMFQAAAEKSIDDYVVKFSNDEKSALDYFKSQGKKIYVPDLVAFRTYAQKKYVDKYGGDWPKGALERINSI
jgi:TRAP-type transport system periplasmic protein